MRHHRPLPNLAVRALLLAGTCGLVATVAWMMPAETTRPPGAAKVMPIPVAPPQTSPTHRVPSFDIVHIAPGGSAVLAGRAEPGDDVAVLAAGRLVGRVHADAEGAWVLIPQNKLPTGAVALTLVATAMSGAVIPGDAPVLTSVPSGPDAVPLAVIVPSEGPSRLLQAPDMARPGQLGLETVDYDDRGAIHFSGTAPARVPLRLYVDGAAAGDAAAGADGRWLLAPSRLVAPGLHTLRLDQLAANGAVAARMEWPFFREVLDLAAAAPGEVVVQPRENLWRLARRAYGIGTRYTVIYQANRSQIRDPNLIYVGQVFAIPAP